MSQKGDVKDRMNRKKKILEDRQAYYANQAYPDQQSFHLKLQDTQGEFTDEIRIKSFHLVHSITSKC